MIKLPNLNTRRWRAQMRVYERFGQWAWSFELVGARGGLHFHVTGPHHYDNMDHWSSGLEYHSRTPRADEPPSQNHCWLLDVPCWHDGTSMYAEEHYLPMWHRGAYDAIFRSMIHDADGYFYGDDGESLGTDEQATTFAPPNASISATPEVGRND